MKNYLLIVCLFLIHIAYGQGSEIQFSYLHSVKNSEIGSGVALTYFYNLTEHSAIGGRLNFNTQNVDYFLKDRNYVTSIDLIQRWNLLKNSKIRIMPELGFSYLRGYQVPDYYSNDCAFCLPITIEPTLRNLNFLGWTFGINTDINISDSLSIGLGYFYSRYIFNNWNYYDEKLNNRNFIFFTNYRF